MTCQMRKKVRVKEDMYRRGGRRAVSVWQSDGVREDEEEKEEDVQECYR